MYKQLITILLAVLMLVAGTASAASYIVLGSGPGMEIAIRTAGGTITQRLPEIGAVVVDSRSVNLPTRLAGVAGVDYVLPDLVVDWYGGVLRAANAVTAQVASPPNTGNDDIFLDLQWGHDAVNAPEAWQAGYRGRGARVAVLDGGFSSRHPDIAPNLDPSCSANFTDEEFAYGPNSSDPSGIFSHGMHVAGIIAAADNGIGTIGIAPEANLCLVKVLLNEGVGSFLDVVRGLIWTANQGVDVINMSLGTALYKAGWPGLYSAREAAGFKILVNRAVTYASQRGALVVVSAGNDAVNGDKDGALIYLPRDASRALSVAATGPTWWGRDPAVSLDNPATYSNFGRSAISLAAPGGDLRSFFSSNNAKCTVALITDDCYVFDWVFSTGAVASGIAYFYWSVGTSMAAPHASGVAALAVSRFGRMSPAQLRRIIERGADDLGQPGNDPFFGAGRVNAATSIR